MRWVRQVNNPACQPKKKPHQRHKKTRQRHHQPLHRSKKPLLPRSQRFFPPQLSTLNPQPPLQSVRWKDPAGIAVERLDDAAQGRGARVEIASLDPLHTRDVQVRFFRELLLRDVFFAALPSQIRSEDFEVCRFHGRLTRAIQRQVRTFGNSAPRCKMKGAKIELPAAIDPMNRSIPAN